MKASQRRRRAPRQTRFSQEALARGINRTYLSAVERSERNISIDNIARIASGLEAEPWELLRGN